jgi:putative heme iron utilization protein
MNFNKLNFCSTNKNDKKVKRESTYWKKGTASEHIKNYYIETINGQGIQTDGSPKRYTNGH